MISINNLNFGYNKGNFLFRDLTLKLSEGKTYGLLGRNGAGKTTLLKILTGLRFFSSGSVDVAGFDPCARNPQMLQKIFFIMEENLLPAISIGEYQKRLSPFYPGYDETLFRTCLQKYDVDVKKNLGALSYGQRKKVLLAFGLACNAPILILDEPTNGLDIPSKTQFRSMLADAENENRIIVISTHQVRDIEDIIEDIIILEKGSVIFQKPYKEVSKRVKYDIRKDAAEEASVIYQERVPGGFAVLEAAEQTQDSSRLDLEILFNAITANPEKFHNLL
ncbi:MAG: ATP-binding cassette domain-containing protein [Chitinispirillaceae bacterium]